MDVVEKILGIMLLCFIFVVVSFIVVDISKSVFKKNGGIRKFIYYKIKNFFK